MKHKTIGELCHEKAARPVPFFFSQKRKQNETKKTKTGLLQNGGGCDLKKGKKKKPP